MGNPCVRSGTLLQLKEMNNEQHFTQSVGACHSIQHDYGWLCSVHADADRTAYTASRQPNGHLCANLSATSYLHTAPDIHAHRRSYPNLDTGGNVGHGHSRSPQ